MDSPINFFSSAPPSEVSEEMKPQERKMLIPSSSRKHIIKPTPLRNNSRMMPRFRTPIAGVSSNEQDDAPSTPTRALYSPESFMSPPPTKHFMTTPPKMQRSNKRMCREDSKEVKRELGDIHPHLLLPSFDDFVIKASPTERPRRTAARMTKLSPLHVAPLILSKSTPTPLNEKDMNSILECKESTQQEVDTIESRPASPTSTCLLKLEPTEISSPPYPIESRRGRMMSTSALSLETFLF